MATSSRSSRSCASWSSTLSRIAPTSMFTASCSIQRGSTYQDVALRTVRLNSYARRPRTPGPCWRRWAEKYDVCACSSASLDRNVASDSSGSIPIVALRGATTSSVAGATAARACETRLASSLGSITSAAMRIPGPRSVGCTTSETIARRLCQGSCSPRG